MKNQTTKLKQHKALFNIINDPNMRPAHTVKAHNSQMNNSRNFIKKQLQKQLLAVIDCHGHQCSTNG
jgi:hypothetical protein